jgi:hypothetical protein
MLPVAKLTAKTNDASVWNQRGHPPFFGERIERSLRAFLAAHHALALHTSESARRVFGMSTIERLEVQIEELDDAIRRSRHLMRGGEIAAILGALLLAGLLLGLMRFSPILMMLGIGLGLGGIVLAGSSKTSTSELEDRFRKANEARIAAIDDLYLVQLPDVD